MSSDKPACGICAGIEQIKARKSRDFVAELKNSYVILGEYQFYRGYCILFAKQHATELYLMPADAARGLFNEVRLVAEAIAVVAQPWKMNYECLGNSEPHVHWHLFPRMASEPEGLKRLPIWLRPEPERKVQLDENNRAELMTAPSRNPPPLARCAHSQRLADLEASRSHWRWQ